MDFEKIGRAAKNRQRAVKTVTYVLLTVWAAAVLVPFYWMVLTSVKSYSAYNSEYIPKLYTLAPTLQNYADAFTAVPLADYFVNTLIFTVLTTALMLLRSISDTPQISRSCASTTIISPAQPYSPWITPTNPLNSTPWRN